MWRGAPVGKSGKQIDSYRLSNVCSQGGIEMHDTDESHSVRLDAQSPLGSSSPTVPPMAPDPEVGQPVTVRRLPLRVAIAFGAFGVRDLTPYKYFLLLLNRLQRTCQFEIHDIDGGDAFLRSLAKSADNAQQARDGLADFGERFRRHIEQGIKRYDLAKDAPDQFVLITGLTLSDSRYLIRRGRTTMLALGLWEKYMAPPSLAEFLQLLALRAPYSAIEGHVWNQIHLGNRACIFDFTAKLSNTRLMALTGVGVCSDCERALELDGFQEAASEIRRIASREWCGTITEVGSPAHVMARLGYNLFLTKGFEASFLERVKKVLADDGLKEFVKISLALLLAWLLIRLGLKGA
jgi:hypothetical protein